jgi:uncharacterized damage-inducible protein DinB
VTSAGLLADAFDRVREVVHEAVEGLTDDELTARVAPGANTVAWLVWHLTRVQDDHIAEVAGSAQVWTAGGWADRLGLPLDPVDTGYGHTREQVAAVRAPAGDLLGYHDAVHRCTADYVGTLTDDDLARVVDDRWEPPVTLGVRLVSVLSDDLQHAGQAAFLRGLLRS